MARVNAQEYAEKWATRTKAATQDYRRGVERVTEAPGEMAARQADAMLAGITQAIADGTWARQVAKVTLTEWKEKALSKGAGRIAGGVDGASAKVAQNAQALLAAVDAAVAAANRTPRGSLEDNIVRMTTYAREMAARAPKRQG